MKWITSINIELLSQKSPIFTELISFLEIENSIEWTYFTKITNNGISTLITVSKCNLLVPVRSKNLYECINGLIIHGGLKIELNKSINCDFNFYYIVNQFSVSDIQQLVTSLIKLDNKNFILSSQVKCINIQNYDSLIKFSEQLLSAKFRFIDNKNQSTNSNYINKNNRYFGNNINTRTNKIIELINSSANNNQLQYEYIINELVNLEYNSEKINDDQFEIKLKEFLISVGINMTFYQYSLTIGIGIDDEYSIKTVPSLLKSIGITLSNKQINNYFTHKKDIWRILRIPRIERNIELSKEKALSQSNNYSPERIVGNIMKNYTHYSPFGINVSDFTEGGIIAGAIGTGKTTLRLHIMKFLMDSNIRIIDFDLKGDAARYPILGDNGIIQIPGINFHINPFEKPSNYSVKEYSDILMRTFVEVLPDNDFSPPQKNLLNKSIIRTISQNGNSLDFFNNILMLSYYEQISINNKQDLTAQSLLIRFNWMKNSLGSIFWKNSCTLSESDYLSSSLFFDFSVISHTATHSQIKFIIDLITTRIMSSHRNLGSNQNTKRPMSIIFLDESQIIMPRNKNGKLSRIEETLSTLRYKGISVIGTGVSAELMSSILLDTNFVVQYRTESRELIRSLGIVSKEEGNVIPRLPQYNCIVRIKSGGLSPIIASISKFPFNQDEITYFKRVKNQIIGMADHLSEFDINHSTIWAAKIDSLFINHIKLIDPVKKQLEGEGYTFILEEIIPSLTEIKNDKIINLVNLMNEKYHETVKLGLLSQYVKDEPYNFLLICLNFYFKQLAINLEGNIRIKNFEINYIYLINSAVKYLSDIFEELYTSYDESTHTEFHLIYSKIIHNKSISDDEVSIFPKSTMKFLKGFLDKLIFDNCDINSSLSIEDQIGVAMDLNLISIDQYMILTRFSKHYSIPNKQIFQSSSIFKLSVLASKELILLENIESISLID